MPTLGWKGWGAAEQWRGDQQLHGTIKLHRQSWGTESLLVLWQKKVHSAQKFGRWARVRCKGSRHWVYRAVCIEAPTRHTQLAYPDHPQPWWRFYLPPAKKLQKKKKPLWIGVSRHLSATTLAEGVPSSSPFIFALAEPFPRLCWHRHLQGRAVIWIKK